MERDAIQGLEFELDDDNKRAGASSDQPLLARTAPQVSKGEAYEEAFGARDAIAKQLLDNQPSRLTGRFRQRSRQMQAELENFTVGIKEGDELKVNASASSYASYIAFIHRKIHARWAERFLRYVDQRHPDSHELNNPSLQATVSIVINGTTGVIGECDLLEGSGVQEYDQEVVRICHDVDPRIGAPGAIVSVDGNVYLRWNFYRDQRYCGTFGVSIYQLTEDGLRLNTSGQIKDHVGVLPDVSLRDPADNEFRLNSAFGLDDDAAPDDAHHHEEERAPRPGKEREAPAAPE